VLAAATQSLSGAENTVKRALGCQLDPEDAGQARRQNVAREDRKATGRLHDFILFETAFSGERLLLSDFRVKLEERIERS